MSGTHSRTHSRVHRDKKVILTITAVSLTSLRHSGYRIKSGTSFIDPVSSKLLKSLDSGSAKNAVRNDGNFYDFHVSQASKVRLALCSKGSSHVRTMLTGQQ